MTSDEHRSEEETPEFVLELDGSNDHLNSALRQANEEADRRWEGRSRKMGAISFEMKLDSVCLLVAMIEKVPLLESWYKARELACALAIASNHGWVAALTDEGKQAIEDAFLTVCEALNLSESELYNMSLGEE